MNRTREKKEILFGAILALFFIFSVTGFAQDSEYTDDSAYPTQDNQAQSQATQEQVLDFRKKILEALGLPTDQPTSLLEILQGKRLGLKIPERGPLSDMKIVLDKSSMKPGEKVRAVVATQGIELAGASIVWQQHKQTVLSGKGEVSYEFTVGPLGSDDSLRVTVTLPDGIVKTVSKAVYPSKIHLAWSSNGYTPAWYRGKALPTSSSFITFVAIPDIRTGASKLSVNNLIFRWEVNGVRVSTGTGKNTYQLTTSDLLKIPYRITVGASDILGQISHVESFNVETYVPQLIFYEYNSLYGTGFARALTKTGIRSGESLTIQVEPFFLPLSELKSTEFSWKINNTKTENTDPQNRLFHLTTEAGARGTQNISVSSINNGAVRRFGSAHLDIVIPEPTTE